MKKGVITVIAVAVLAVIFYGIRYVNLPTETLTIHAQTKEHTIVSDAVIVYNEEVYTAENSGTFYSYMPEGERVGKDRLIATVYDGVVDKEVLQSLSNIDKKISDIEEGSGKSESYVSDTASEQTRVESVKNNIIDAVIEEEFSDIYEYKTKLESSAASEMSDSEHELNSLRAEKREIEAKISNENRDIYSRLAGIYSTAMDGLEGTIKPSDIGWYMVYDYKNLKTPEKGAMGNRTVEAGDAVCKVVDNHLWYAVTVISDEECRKIKKGDSVKLRVKELPGEIVDAKIDYISPEPEGAKEYLVGVKCERYLEGVFNIRKSEIEIILESNYGYEIPLYAVHVRDGEKGVMVKTATGQTFKKCEILDRDDARGTVVIGPTETGSTIVEGDKIILGEK